MFRVVKEKGELLVNRLWQYLQMAHDEQRKAMKLYGEKPVKTSKETKPITREELKTEEGELLDEVEKFLGMLEGEKNG